MAQFRVVTAQTMILKSSSKLSGPSSARVGGHTAESSSCSFISVAGFTVAGYVRRLPCHPWTMCGCFVEASSFRGRGYSRYANFSSRVGGLRPFPRLKTPGTVNVVAPILPSKVSCISDRSGATPRNGWVETAYLNDGDDYNSA